MSAIFGILRFDGGEVSRRELERMSNNLSHRGPDGRKFVIGGPIGLGHCLLRVNQEDQFEAQPLRDRDAGLTLVADGRIDNREELADAFGIDAAALRDMPDSALILGAYKKWGAACAGHLLGDFAFAVWDERAKTLVLGRDHMGQRYVHYHRAKGFFAFATEIKALWALADVPRALCDAQVGRFLVMDLQPREGATFFEDILGLPGGTILSVEACGTMSKRQYWEPGAAAEHIGRDEAYYVDAYRRVLTEAVACRIRRLTGPPALCLSTGFDSTAIAGLSGPVVTAMGRKLVTMSSVLAEDGQGPSRDIRPWAEICRRDMPHLDVRYFVRGPDTFFSGLEKAYGTADQPPSFAAYIVDQLFEIAAGAGARLVMDGIGGDATLNPRGGAALARLLRRGDLRRFLSELRARKKVAGKPFVRSLGGVALNLAPSWMWRAWLRIQRIGPGQARQFVAPPLLRALMAAGAVDPGNLPDGGRTATASESCLRRLRNAAGRPRAFHANEAAARGLDLTRPMYDKRVVELGLAIPEDLHVVNGRDRYLARRALAHIYPPEYQTRPSRQDPFDPDYRGLLNRARARMQTELKQMASGGALGDHIALDALGAAFDRAGAGGIIGDEEGYADRAFRVARYLAWFRRRNA